MTSDSATPIELTWTLEDDLYIIKHFHLIYRGPYSSAFVIHDGGDIRDSLPEETL